MTVQVDWKLLGLDFDGPGPQPGGDHDGDLAAYIDLECGGRYPMDRINWDLMPEPRQHVVTEEQATMTWIWWNFVRPHFGLNSFEAFMSGQVLGES